MSSVVISGDTSGAITLAVPAVAGTNTVTLPAAAGTVMVSGNMPAFYAYYFGSDISISSGVSTKVTYDTELYDTNNNFASSRFTPTVAGYYQINCGVYMYTGAGNITQYFASIYKNGTEYTRNQTKFAVTVVSEGMQNVSSIVYLNGSTDYIEIYANITGTSPYLYGGGQARQFVNGCLLRAA